MEKYIEKMFIEEPIYRKQKIFEYLISKKSSTIKQICNLINISVPTLYKEIDQINQLSQDFVKIQSGIVYLNFTTEKQAKSFLNKLYKQSDFLSLLSLYIFNTTRKKSLELPISRSKFYNVRSKVIQFLKINDLEIKNQLVIGSRLKINWIKSLLSIKYGFHPLENDFIYYHTKKFIQKINIIESCYLTEKESKIFLYHLNLILKNPDEVILTSKEEKLFTLIISPPFLENDLKNLFNTINCQNKKNLLNYAKLCYFLLSTHAFSPKIKSEYKNKITKLLFDYPEISELIHKLENNLNINIKDNEFVFNILYNHLKLCVINWQLPLNLELTSNLNDNKNHFIEIFHNWNKKNNLNLILPTPILNNLFENLIKMKNLDTSPKLFIYTDSWIKYTEISNSLKNQLAVRISLIDFWISSKEELLNLIHPKDIIISDDYFFSYSINHQNNFYLPNLSESELNNVSKQIIDCLYNFSMAN